MFILLVMEWLIFEGNIVIKKINKISIQINKYFSNRKLPHHYLSNFEGTGIFFFDKSLFFHANIIFFQKMICYPERTRTNPLRFLRWIITFREHYEIRLQTSYRQKKNPSLQLFARPESWYRSLPELRKNDYIAEATSLKKSYIKNDLKVTVNSCQNWFQTKMWWVGR